MGIDHHKDLGKHRDSETTSDEDAQIKHDESFQIATGQQCDQYGDAREPARIQPIFNCKELFLRRRTEAFTHKPDFRIASSTFST